MGKFLDNIGEFLKKNAIGASIIIILVAIGYLFFWVFLYVLNMPIVALMSYIVIVTVGMVLVSVIKDSEVGILISLPLVIFIALFLFANVYTITITSKSDFMAVYGTPKNLTFSEAMYFSTVTMTTLGYGDITPHGFYRTFAAVEALLGPVFLGIFVFSISRLRK